MLWVCRLYSGCRMEGSLGGGWRIILDEYDSHGCKTGLPETRNPLKLYVKLCNMCLLF